MFDRPFNVDGNGVAAGLGVPREAVVRCTNDLARIEGGKTKVVGDMHVRVGRRAALPSPLPFTLDRGQAYGKG